MTKKVDDGYKISSPNTHALDYSSPKLYSIVNGKYVNNLVSVHYAVQIDSEMRENFRSNIPNEFHSKVPVRVKVMEYVKYAIKVKDKAIYDMGATCTRFLNVGQHLDISLSKFFKHELCCVPPSLIEEYGCLNKGNRSVLVDRLREKDNHAVDPHVVIVEGQQLLYHVMLSGHLKGQSSVFPLVLKVSSVARAMKFVVFDRYVEHSAKGHERMGRSGEGSVEYSIKESNTPHRESVMKNKFNKKAQSQVLFA